MAVNVKMGVDLSGFNSGIRQGQAILKGLNAEMKATEAEFKATGNSEQKLAAQTKTLNSQLQVQKGIADQAAAALKKLDAAGVQPTDIAYQKLYATLMNAQAGMNEAQAALNALDGSQQQAASSADALATSVNGIGKKISLDQVLSGINSITSGLENAAKKAVQLGEAIWNNVMDSARLADDILTQATLLDMTPERYQQYKGVFDTIGEITITEWAAAKRKVQKAMNDPSQDQMDVLSLLGIGTQMTGKNGEVEKIERNWEDMFWEAATKLKSKVEAGEITQDMADTWGEALFGKKFSSLKALINLGQEGFNEALETVNTASDEALEKDAALHDQVIKLNESFEALKMEVTSALAPALTEAAKALDSLLGSVLEYLKTPEGKEMLKSLGDSVSELFSGMKNINAEDVVNGFKDAFDKVMNVLNWIVDNKDTVVTALEGIFGFWATLKVSEGVGTILKVINGLKDLAGIGGSGAAGAASWVSTAMTTASQAVANYLGNPVLQSALPVIGDWFTYNSTIGHWLMGTETPADTLEGIKQNISTFAEDWMNNVPFRALLQVLTGGFAFGTGGEDGFDENEELIRQDLERMLNEEPFDFTAEPVVSEDAAESIASQIGVVQLPAHVYVSTVGGAGAGGGKYSYLAMHANGLPYVPYDGYLAQLHRGERVLTASENKSYTYNSNNYFGNVNLNNGQDIEALCDSIDRHNRRQRSGYGS